MKVLLNNREDFDNWYKCNDSYNRISYEEDVPKYYPCVVSFRILSTGYSIYDDLYYEFVYLEDFKLNKDNEEFFDYETEFIAIDKEDISIGDYIEIECERFASDSCHLQIVDIQQRFDEITGEPYKIVIDEEDEIWSTQNGNCLSNPKTFYQIYGYFRELK